MTSPVESDRVQEDDRTPEGEPARAAEGDQDQRSRKDWAKLRQQVTEDRERRGRNKTGASWFRKSRRAIGQLAVRTFFPSMMRLFAKTWRLTEVGRQEFEQNVMVDGAVIAMWHGRMFPALPQHRHRGIHVLVSPSRDGDIVQHTLGKFGYKVIRGSTSRGGVRAMREMSQRLTKGQSVCITPDGPRGPIHSMNIGLAWLARESGLPIVCVGVAADRAWHLKSWDRFMIPKPFARIAMIYGEPIPVEKDAPESRLEEVTELVRRTLFEVEGQAFAALGVEKDF